MNTYLVTGAAGFIGSNFARFVLDQDQGARVVALDNLGFSANEANLDGIREAIDFVVADIADLEVMSGVYSRYSPDFIVNFAAESHNDRAILDPSGFMRSNALGAQVLLECSRRHGVRRHLHVSTIEVYGELAPGEPAFDEGCPLNAKTPYSAAKAAGDQMVRAYMQTYPDLDIAMTHCANNYGPFQLPEKLIPLMVTNVLRGKKVPVYGDGLQRRDWLHVVDHCRAIWSILHSPRAPIPHEAAFDASLLPIFDVSARCEVTNLEIVERVLQVLDRDPAEWAQHVADRPNHDRRYLIDPTKIETHLGWAPTVDFDAGLAATVRWYVENEGWWRAIFDSKGDLEVHWG
ncbi:MAG: dTDP-glucose 4,6-dehydratase [Acidimicrobiales bacterium]